jgi:hypothetical protein
MIFSKGEDGDTDRDQFMSETGRCKGKKRGLIQKASPG